MLDPIGVQEEINAARSDIWRAVKLDPGPSSRRALEGDLESAYMRLGDATQAIDGGDVSFARDAVAEALELLRSRESREIAADGAALQAAIDRLAGVVL